MRQIIKEVDKDGNECWATYLGTNQLSIYYSEAEAQKNINDVQLD